MHDGKGCESSNLYSFPNFNFSSQLSTHCINSRFWFYFSYHAGVLLTLREHVLSCQLKLYESILQKNHDMADGFLKLREMSNKYVRSILDESDAILYSNYQMIYTVGEQLRPDGGSLRWNVAQAVLKHVSPHMKRLWKTYGDEMIEFNDTHSDRDDIFKPCRILNETIFEQLKSALVEDFLEGRLDINFPEIVQATKDHLRSVLMQSVDGSMALQLHEFPTQRDTVLILSGLLRFEVLKLILTKRWRVNYGVNVEGRRQMAIPFRAKDCPNECSEFGHTDVAICYTLLSYYYSGKFQ